MGAAPRAVFLGRRDWGAADFRGATITMPDVFEREIGGWLDQRRAPPGMSDTEKQSYRSDIIETVRSNTPKDLIGDDLTAWLGRVKEGAILRMKGASWPAPDVWAIAVGGAAVSTNDILPPTKLSNDEQSYRLFVERMNSGQPVGEDDLFRERRATRALREGVISFDDVRQRQRAAFFAKREFYGEQYAFDWMDEKNPALAADLRQERDAARAQQAPRLPHADDTDDAGDFA